MCFYYIIGVFWIGFGGADFIVRSALFCADIYTQKNYKIKKIC